MCPWHVVHHAVLLLLCSRTSTKSGLTASMNLPVEGRASLEAGGGFRPLYAKPAFAPMLLSARSACLIWPKAPPLLPLSPPPPVLMLSPAEVSAAAEAVIGVSPRYLLRVRLRTQPKPNLSLMIRSDIPRHIRGVGTKDATSDAVAPKR